MDTARQVLRFSIPGSVTLLLITGFLVLGRLLQGDSWDGIGHAVKENISPAVAILAAIPLGFVIYQVYYATYRATVWPWRPRPFSSGERWVRIDRGAQVLSRLPTHQQKRVEEMFEIELDLKEILKAETSWLGRRAHAYRLKKRYVNAAVGRRENPYLTYRKRWQVNWNIVRALVEISDGDKSGTAIRNEYTTLSDIYHALGACRAGAQLAWIVSSLACCGYVIAGGSLLGSLLTCAITAVLMLTLFWVFHRTRGHTWVSAQESIKLGLTGLFKRRPDLLDGPAGG